MYQRTTVLTKPTPETEFFDIMDDKFTSFRAYWQETFKVSGKLLLVDRQLSEDQLTRTTTFFWDSEESYQQAIADPVVIAVWAERDAVHAALGIVKISETGTTV
jgi:hypothetical protein